MNGGGFVLNASVWVIFSPFYRDDNDSFYIAAELWVLWVYELRHLWIGEHGFVQIYIDLPYLNLNE